LLGQAAFSSKVAHLPTVEAWKVAGRKMLWWPDGRLLWRWSRGTVELLLRLLLLELLWLELWVMAPILLLMWLTQLTPVEVYTMRYFRGAPQELSLQVDLGIILFLFFSSAIAIAFIILSWSMAALTNSLYVKLERCTRRSSGWMVSPAWYRLAFFSSVSTWYDPY
jgi:hypothetical protein